MNSSSEKMARILVAFAWCVGLCVAYIKGGDTLSDKGSFLMYFLPCNSKIQWQLIITFLSLVVSTQSTTQHILYIGTFTPPTGSGQGIYKFIAANNNGWLRNEVIKTIGNPSFIIANKNGSRLYAVNELYNYEGEIGAVSAYEIDPNSKNLTFINSRQSAGNGPTHLALDPTEKYILVANYGTGNVAVYPLNSYGGIDPISDYVLPVSQKGNSPNAHMIAFNPHNNYVAAVFLGLDKVLFYTLNMNSGKLEPVYVQNDRGDSIQLHVSVKVGSGCRHLAFDNDSDFLYVVSEVGNTVTVFDTSLICNGSYGLIQTISTLPSGYKNVSYAGEIAIHPSSRFLYVSNRGHDSIAVYSIDNSSGVLTPIQFVPVLGSFPRHFLINKQGNRMFISNQNSNNVVVFSIDEYTGYLLESLSVLNVSTPTCTLLV